MRPRRSVLAVLACVVAALASATGAVPAGAAVPTHAQLVSTTPGDGDTVESVAAVTLTFSEDINGKFLQVRVEGQDGSETDGSPTADGHVVTQPLAADLPAGEHQVTYRVVSVDGHPVSGTFTFTTTQSPSATQTSTAPTPSASSSTTPPAVSSPGPSPSPVSTATASEGVPSWVVPAVIGLLVLVLVAAGFLLARPRRGPDEGSAG